MTNALATMRVDYDHCVNIKNLADTNNPILNKRRRKEPPKGAEAQ